MADPITARRALELLHVGWPGTEVVADLHYFPDDEGCTVFFGDGDAAATIHWSGIYDPARLALLLAAAPDLARSLVGAHNEIDRLRSANACLQRALDDLTEEDTP